MGLLFRNTISCLIGLVGFSICLVFSSPSKAMEGGTVVDAADYPGLVMLSYDEIPNTFNFNNCSGVILEPRRILTTASCVYTLSSNSAGFIPIPASKIHIHMHSQGEIGPFTGIQLAPSDTKNFGVSSYVIHPQNPFSGGHHNLAILYLNTNINEMPASIYNGSNKFVGATGTALGWEKVQSGGFPLSNNYYVMNKLSFTLIDGNADISSFFCYDSFVYTGSVFCGGFRNGIKFLDNQDQGAPIYRKVNGKQTAIGLLANASNGILIDGEYVNETYARLSSMVNFIKQHAADTKFHNESIVAPELKINITSMLQLLLLSKD